jgi:hypothetical protein
VLEHAGGMAHHHQPGKGKTMDRLSLSPPTGRHEVAVTRVHAADCRTRKLIESETESAFWFTCPECGCEIAIPKKGAR